MHHFNMKVLAPAEVECNIDPKYINSIFFSDCIYTHRILKVIIDSEENRIHQQRKSIPVVTSEYVQTPFQIQPHFFHHCAVRKLWNETLSTLPLASASSSNSAVTRNKPSTASCVSTRETRRLQPQARESEKSDGVRLLRGRQS